MTRDEIIGIAFKAGFPDWWLHPPEPERQDGEVLAMLGRFAALVAAAERERVATEFDRRAVYSDGTPSSGWYEPHEPGEIVRRMK